MIRPLLGLDVDGVLCPFDDPGGYERVPTGEGDWIWFSDENRTRLQTLARSFQLVWATSWEHKANEIIAPLHGLAPLPVIEFYGAAVEELVPESQPADWVGYHDWKLPWIQGHVGTRRFAWLDDEISDLGIAWAQRCRVPALFVRPSPSIGLTDEHVDRLVEFAEA